MQGERNKEKPQALPVYSVDTEAEAEDLLCLATRQMYDGRLVLNGWAKPGTKEEMLPIDCDMPIAKSYFDQEGMRKQFEAAAQKLDRYYTKYVKRLAPPAAEREPS